MKDSEVSSVHVNGCVRDSEIEELERLVRDADPGEWRVVDGEVQRFGGKPFERREASLRLMARARDAIPRLIRGIRVLEEALRTARAGYQSARAELHREREGRSEDAKRRAEGRTGPDGDLAMVARLAMHGAYRPETIEGFVREWAAGRSLEHLRQDAIDAERAATEKRRTQQEVIEQFQRDRAELTRLLELARAGKLPVDVVRAGGRRRG